MSVNSSAVKPIAISAPAESPAEPANTSTGADATSQNFPKPPTPATASSAHAPPSISPRQLAALDLMLAGRTGTDIAKELNVSRRTLYTWRTGDPAFIQALVQRSRDLYNNHVNQFLNLLTQALGVLHKQAADPWSPTSHRAARTILSQSRLGQYLFLLANSKRPDSIATTTSASRATDDPELIEPADGGDEAPQIH